MARANVVHADDAVTVIFNGNKASPEPTSAIIKFPGGFVEVTRTSDSSYWAHLHVTEPGNIVDSRLDYVNPGIGQGRSVSDIPNGISLTNMALRIANVKPTNHFE